MPQGFFRLRLLNVKPCGPWGNVARGLGNKCYDSMGNYAAVETGRGSMRTHGTYGSICAAALSLCLALAGCGAGDSSQSDASSGPKVTITQMGEEEESQRRGSARKESDSEHNVLSTCLGTIAERFADDHGNPMVEKEMARKVFSFVIEGETMELPCPVKQFFDKGWQLEQGYTYENMRYDPGFAYEVGMWHKGDANYNIKVLLKNTSDEVIPWEELTVVGLTIRPIDSYVSFECEAGVDRDSDLDELLEVFGCNDESALLANKTIVEYHVSLYDGPLYDMHATVYGNIVYDWNKTGKVATSLAFEILEPWDTDLRKTEEELAEERAKREEEGDYSSFSDVSDYVGRTVEGN